MPVPVRYFDKTCTQFNYNSEFIIDIKCVYGQIFLHCHFSCLSIFIIFLNTWDYLCVHPAHILKVVLVTDGSLGIGKGSLRHSLQTLKQRGDDKKFPLPFPFPTKLFIMCIANAEEVLFYSLADLTINFNVHASGSELSYCKIKKGI